MYLSTACTRAVVLGNHELESRRRWPTASFVRTPLDLIQLLERASSQIDTVIVPGERRDVVAFLRDAYPDLHVTIDAERAHSLVQPRYALAT